MSSRLFHLKLIVLAVSLVYSNMSKADNDSLLPLTSRASLWGTIGDMTNGRLDAMIPLFGSGNGIFYTDIQGQYGSDKSFSEGLGLGVRQTLSDNLLLGGYSFIDNIQTVDSSGYTAKWLVFNPGIEAMTNNWDGRINGYFPVGPDTRTVSQQTLFGDQFQGPHAPSSGGVVQGHTEFDQLFLFSRTNEIPKGLDADVGYTFLNMNRVRVHGGGYYFSFPQSSNMTGAEAGVEVPVNKYISLEFNDSYDNLFHNTALVSVRFTLGGITKSNIHPTVQDRMLDPIQRHLGAIATDSGIPSQETKTSKVLFDGALITERNNIWFFNASSGSVFNPAAGTNNCTAENPCIGTDFNQTNVQTINGLSPNASFYFTPGTYNFSNRFTLYTGQSMWGRNGNYSQAASGPFPTFVGGLDPEGNNILDSIALINNGSESKGINILNANNITMNNLQISGFDFPISLDNATNIKLTNSTIDALTTDLLLDHNSQATTEHNTFNISSNDNQADIKGISVDNNSILTSINDTFNLTGIPLQATGIYTGYDGATVMVTGGTFALSVNNDLSHEYGIKTNSGTVTVNNSFFNINSIASQVFGIYNNSSTVNVANSTFDVRNSNEASVLALVRAFGVYNQGATSNTTVDKSTFNVESDSPEFDPNNPYSAVGYVNLDGGQLAITDSIFNFTVNTGQGGPNTNYAKAKCGYGTANIVGSTTFNNCDP